MLYCLNQAFSHQLVDYIGQQANPGPRRRRILTLLFFLANHSVTTAGGTLVVTIAVLGCYKLMFGFELVSSFFDHLGPLIFPQLHRVLLNLAKQLLGQRRRGARLRCLIC